MNRVKVISIGFAVPRYSYSQEEIWNEMHYPKHFWRVFRDSGIEQRHFCIPLERVRTLTFQQQQEQYLKSAVPLSQEAILNCLDRRDVKQVKLVVFGSCTGLAPGPTVPHWLAKLMGFSPSTFYTNIIGQGCESGFPGLKRAYDFCKATGGVALMVNTELCSLTYFPEPDGKPDPENDYELLRANALFADASVSVLVGYDDNPHHPEIVDMETCTNTEYLGDLGYSWRDGRLRVMLSKRVPAVAPIVVKSAVEAVLARQHLAVGDIAWWVVHAAGNLVLDNIRDCLGISEEKMVLSRETLRLNGNTSSTSVGITGKKLMAQDIQPGDYAAILSIGPGITGGMTLLNWGG